MIHPSPSFSACAAKNTGFGRNANPLLRGAMPGTLTLDGLEKLVRGGEIDTVLVAFPDQQGRLMGKRVTGSFFLDQVARDGMHACAYLLTVDVDMTPLPGYRMASWATGYQDFHAVPDWTTLRRIPWLEKTALVLCDLEDEHHRPIEASPRRILQRQGERAPTADDHVVYKNGAKEIAHAKGVSITFMAKYDMAQAGSSFHLHSSLWDKAGRRNLFHEKGKPHGSALFGQWVAGQIACARELAWFYAPYVNSYKRYQAGTFAPTRIAWALDNRTTGFRACGEGPSLRIENRIPGADANPYLAFAATIAAGLHGIEKKLKPPPLYHGNAYEDGGLPQVPGSLQIGRAHV